MDSLVVVEVFQEMLALLHPYQPLSAGAPRQLKDTSTTWMWWWRQAEGTGYAEEQKDLAGRTKTDAVLKTERSCASCARPSCATKKDNIKTFPLSENVPSKLDPQGVAIGR